MIRNTCLTGGSVGPLLAGVPDEPPPTVAAAWVTVCAVTVCVTVGGGEDAGAELGDPSEDGELLTGAAGCGAEARFGDTARSTGAPELSASELAPEPTTTPKASVDITATAAARGESEARRASGPSLSPSAL